MAINFPSNPSTNDTYTVNGRTYIWTGEKWRRRRPRIEYTPPTMDVTNDFTAGSALKVDSDNSSVGIGTMTPNSDDALTVSGHTTITDGIVVDTDTLVVDATNDRVGIGTTSPSETLTVDGNIDVVGAARTINFGSLDEGGPHGLEVAPSGTLESALYYRTTPLSWSFEDGSGGKIAEFVSGTLSTAFDTDTLYVDGVNDRVGIGTTSVTAGHILETRGAVLISSTTGVGNSHFPYTDGRFYYTADPETGGTGDHVFRHYSGGSYVEQMRILENGNVGIGETSPDRKLHVTSTGSEQLKLETTGTTSNRASMEFFTNGNDWEMGARGSAGSPNNSFYLYSKTDAQYRLVVADGGNVGIGNVTSPSYTLDVAGTIRSTSHLRTDSANNVHISLNATSTTSRPYMEIDHYNGSTYRRAGYVGYPENNASGAHMQMVADNGWVNLWAGGAGNGLRVGSPTGSYGTVETSGAGKGGWEGYSINGWAVFMANSSTGNFGIYDDVNNEWALYCDFNGSVDLRYNGSAKASTTSGGLLVSGDIYVSGNDVVFGGTSANDYIRYSDGAQGAMGGRFEFVSDGSSANSQIVAGTGIFLRDSSLSTHDNYQDSTSDYNVITAVNHSAGSGNNWTDSTVICEDDDSIAFVGISLHGDHHNYAPIWRGTTSTSEGFAARTNNEGAFARIMASAFQVNSTADSKEEIVDAPPLLQRFRDYVAEGHHTKQFRRKEYIDPKPAYEQKHALIERDYGKEEADRWLEERTLQNIWTRTDADWLELDKMQNGVEFTEFGVVIDEFGPAFPEVASWEANEDGTEMVPVGLDLSSAVGFLMRLVEDLDEANQTLEARVAALEAE